MKTTRWAAKSDGMLMKYLEEAQMWQRAGADGYADDIAKITAELKKREII